MPSPSRRFLGLRVNPKKRPIPPRIGLLLTCLGTSLDKNLAVSCRVGAGGFVNIVQTAVFLAVFLDKTASYKIL